MIDGRKYIELHPDFTQGRLMEIRENLTMAICYVDDLRFCHREIAGELAREPALFNKHQTQGEER